MKAGYLAAGIILLALLVAVSGCGQKCPECPSSSGWSKCDASAGKSRESYRCGEDTKFQCVSFEEKAGCSTEIRMQGASRFNAVATPALDETVKGVLKLEVGSIPEGTDSIWAMLGPQGMGQVKDPFAEKNVILQVVAPKADLAIFIDTKKVENGVYNLAVMAARPGGQGTSSPWFDVAQTQVIVENL